MTLNTNSRKTLTTTIFAAAVFGSLALAPSASAAVRTDISLTDGTPSITIHNPDGADIMTLDATLTVGDGAADPTASGDIEYRDDNGNLVDPIVLPDGTIDRSGLTRDGVVDADGDGFVDAVPIVEEIEPISAEATSATNWTSRLVSGLIGAAAGLALGRVSLGRRRSQATREAEVIA